MWVPLVSHLLSLFDGLTIPFLYRNAGDGPIDRIWEPTGRGRGVGRRGASGASELCGRVNESCDEGKSGKYENFVALQNLYTKARATYNQERREYYNTSTLQTPNTPIVFFSSSFPRPRSYYRPPKQNKTKLLLSVIPYHNLLKCTSPTLAKPCIELTAYYYQSRVGCQQAEELPTKQQSIFTTCYFASHTNT